MPATMHVHPSLFPVDAVLHVMRRLRPSAQPCGAWRRLSEGLGTPVLPRRTDWWGGTMRRLVTAVTGLALAVALVAAWQTPVEAGDKGKAHPTILPPSSHPYGKTYPEWVAAFWQYALEFPLAGHPFLDTPDFDFSAQQSGHVWFWSAPAGPLTRTVTLPQGKALFLTLRDVECSSLETPEFDPDFGFGAHTAAAQRDCAQFLADHIVDVFCVIDGVPVANLGAYRFVSPQFQFTAPTPWIFGDTGGVGTAVGDGYYLMLAPFRGSAFTPRGHALVLSMALQASSHLRQGGFRLGEPALHLHGAVQRYGSGQLSAGLLYPSWPRSLVATLKLARCGSSPAGGLLTISPW